MEMEINETVAVNTPSKEVIVKIAGEGDLQFKFKDSTGMRAIDLTDADIIAQVMGSNRAPTVTSRSTIAWGEETATQKIGTIYTQAQEKGC